MASRWLKSTIRASATLQIVGKLAVVIFLVEMATMLILAIPFRGATIEQLFTSPDDSGLTVAMVDGALLVLLSAPLVYVCIVDPFVTRRMAAESALQDTQRSLCQAERVARLAYWRWSFAAKRRVSWSGAVMRPAHACCKPCACNRHGSLPAPGNDAWVGGSPSLPRREGSFDPDSGSRRPSSDQAN